MTRIIVCTITRITNWHSTSWILVKRVVHLTPVVWPKPFQALTRYMEAVITYCIVLELLLVRHKHNSCSAIRKVFARVRVINAGSQINSG